MSQEWWARAAALFLAAAALGQAAYAARVQGWTYDEPVHLAWSERLIETGEWERRSQQRFNSKTPVLVPNVLARKAARWWGVEDARWLRFAARLPTVCWLAGLLALVWTFTCRRFGSTAAALATGACALDPNLVAHASLATVDAAYAAATLATLAAAIAFLERPSAARGTVLGAAFGVALAVKFSALLLLPGLVLAPLVAPALRRGRPRALLGGLAAALAAAWMVVCGVYLFRGIGLPLGAETWSSPPFVRLAGAWPTLQAPVPMALLTGLDLSLSDERGVWPGLILGRSHPQGVWYYFVVLWLLKTPLLLLAATVGGSWLAARTRASDAALRVLALSITLGLAYFSLIFRAHIGYRFVLMLLPPLYVLAAAGWASRHGARRTGIAAAAVALVSLAEGLAYLGNPLAFTHLAVQPKRLVYRLMADSNIDWGQDRERIVEEVYARNAGHTHLAPPHILSGHVTLSLNALAGFDEGRHAWVRENLEPRGHFLHTYLWFEIDNATFERFLWEARRLAPNDAAACRSGDLPRHQPGSRVRLAVDRPPAPGQGAIVCADSRRGTDLGLRVRKGRVRFGVLQPDGSCAAALVTEPQVVWYRLDAGRHALCLVEVPNQRAWLPYQLEATWIVRGRALGLEVRPHNFTEPTPPPPGSASLRSSSPPPPPGD